MSADYLENESALNAYIDAQLGPDEREHVLAKIDQDPALREQLCKLRRSKEMVYHAFADAKATRRPIQSKPTRHWQQLAASLLVTALLALSFAGGWLSHEPAQRNAAIQMPVTGVQRVVLHIGHDSQAKFAETLDRAEQLLLEYHNGGAEVEIVANSDGLDLLRTNTSPFAQRIRNMMQMHQGLRFVACSNTIARLEREGKHVFLIENTQRASSAVEHIVKRVKEGWVYVKV